MSTTTTIFFFLVLVLGIVIVAKGVGLNHPMLPYLVSLLPEWLKYPLTVLGFWPTVMCTRVFCFFAEMLGCSRVRLYNRITPSIVLGVAPVYHSFVSQLHASENVRGVINLCKEWNGNEDCYAAKGVKQLYLPTIDFESPKMEDVIRAITFIDEFEKQGASVYVHCKAGRGRSAIIVLAYCVVKQNMSPEQAEAFVRSKRPNIARNKEKEALFKELPVLREGLNLRAPSPK